MFVFLTKTNKCGKIKYYLIKINMDNINLSEKQLVASVALGAALGVLAATMPVEVQSGFEETQVAVQKVLECGGDNFSSGDEVDNFSSDDQVVNYSYVPAQDLESGQIEINEAVNLIIENSN